MKAQKTEVVIRAISCDAKVIGSLVGGCRVTIRRRESGEVLSRGLQLGGSGDTESIMKTPHARGATVYGTSGTAYYSAELDLSEPTPVQIEAEGPMAYPQAIQQASMSTWLIPGESVTGEGIVLTLHGFIVEVMRPDSVDVLHSGDPVHLQASVRLL